MWRHPDIPFWLCVGDVGDDAGVYENVPAPLYWIKGNNEGFDVIFNSCAWGPTPTRSRSAAGLRPAPLRRLARAAGASGADELSNLLYIPNGVEIDIDGLRVAGIGGTFAPTWYDTRASELVKKGKDDKRRHFVREEVEKVKAMSGLDVLLTHEAPRPFRVDGHDAGKTPINEMLASAKPRLHLFGHHHRFVEMTASGVRSVCLDLVSRSYLLINRETLDYEHMPLQ